MAPDPLDVTDRRPSQTDWWQRATTVISFLTVVGLAAGLYLTNAANRAQQDANRAQQDANRAQLDVTIQGQVAERFAQTIDQLGQEDSSKADKLSIRLGAIYSLARLMRDSARDEPAIIDVLCAFVRTHAQRPAGTDRRPSPGADHTPSPADVQAAVVVLANRPDPAADLHRGLNLSGTHLSLPTLRCMTRT
jgi:hypothetical protein